MKKILIIACIFSSIFGIQNLSAYDLTLDDKSLILKFEQTLFPIIDSQGEQVGGRVLDKISDIQSRKISSRISEILEKISEDIDERYTIGKYIVAREHIPLLKTSDFETQFGGSNGKTLNFDRFGEIDAIEHIAPIGTIFTLEKSLENNIYQVSTESYPVGNTLYIHADFVQKIQREKPNFSENMLQSKQEIVKKLRSIQGADYVWGGNIPEGIPKLLSIFPPRSEISDKKKQEWTLTGVDCSGLLYWASNGNTPRNTSWLIEHGERLDIAGRSLDEILPMLEPLDVIVWKGHMMIVLSDTETIESAVSFSDTSLPGGVQIRDIRKSLGEVLKKRTPVNNYSDSQNSPFVIMRWMK